MAKWNRTLTKAEVIEAIRDFLLKKNEIGSKDTIGVMTTALTVQIVDAE